MMGNGCLIGAGFFQFLDRNKMINGSEDVVPVPVKHPCIQTENNHIGRV